MHASKGDDPYGQVASPIKLDKILSQLLSADEALVHSFVVYRSTLSRSGSNTSSIEQKLRGLHIGVWEAISRIVQHSKEQMSDLRLPNKYATRLETYFTSPASILLFQ